MMEKGSMRQHSVRLFPEGASILFWINFWGFFQGACALDPAQNHGFWKNRKNHNFSRSPHIDVVEKKT